MIKVKVYTKNTIPVTFLVQCLASQLNKDKQKHQYYFH